MHTGFVQRGLPRSSPKNAAAPLYNEKSNYSTKICVAQQKSWQDNIRTLTAAAAPPPRDPYRHALAMRNAAVPKGPTFSFLNCYFLKLSIWG